ncbi:hypothetical protein Tco_1255445 [Tanacetum coccineum]
MPVCLNPYPTGLFAVPISQKAGSILNYKDLKAKFRSHFSQQKRFTKTHLAVHIIKQREGESVRAFATRYTDDTLQILGLHEHQRISGFVHGLKVRNLVEHLSTDLPSTYKGLMEKTYTWIEAREVATNGAPNDRRDNFERSKKSSWDNGRGQRSRDKFSSYRGSNHGLLSSLSKSPREILATKKVARSFEQPPRMLKSQIEEAVRKDSNAKNRNEGVKKVRETSSTNTEGVLSCTNAEEKIIVNSKYLEQTVTIGKQLPEHFKERLQNLLRTNADVFTWTHADMTRIHRTIMVNRKPFHTEHKLNEYSHIKPIKQKRRSLGPDRSIAARKEVEELIRAGILWEAVHQTWVANLVMVKKSDEGWRMCVDFTDINKACPKECYPLPEIKWKVESLSGFHLKCFLDADKGYHQIQMAKEDKDKTIFFAGKGVYFIERCPSV